MDTVVDLSKGDLTNLFSVIMANQSLILHVFIYILNFYFAVKRVYKPFLHKFTIVVFILNFELAVGTLFTQFTEY